MTELAQPATDYDVVEREPPEQLGRNLNSAGHLLASASAFFFLAFVFAYFYLRVAEQRRALASEGRPPVADARRAGDGGERRRAPCSLRLGLADHRADRRAAWRVKGALALALGLAAVVLQVVEWTTNGFGPADGGYASVFIGWTGFYVLFLVGALFWLETTARDVASATRRRPGRAAASRSRRGARATPTGRRRTSQTRSRSCAPSSRRSPSTGASSPASASSPGSSSTSPSDTGRSAPVPIMTTFTSWNVEPPLFLALVAARPLLARRPAPGLGPAGRARAPRTGVALLHGPGRGRGRARLAARLARRPAVRGAHGPARAAPERRAAADRALGAVEPALAAAAARLPALGRAGASCSDPRAAARCGRSRTLVARPLFGLGAVQREPRRVARAGALRRDAAQPGACTTSSTRCSSAPGSCSGRRCSTRRRSTRVSTGCGGSPSSAEGSPSGWILSIVLALAPSPLYSVYASLAHRPGGLSALGDQQIAAGVMWVPGSIAFTLAIVVFVYRWLEPETAVPAVRTARAGVARATEP